MVSLVVKRREVSVVCDGCVYVLRSDGDENKDVDEVDIATGLLRQKTLLTTSSRQMMLA